MANMFQACSQDFHEENPYTDLPKHLIHETQIVCGLEKRADSHFKFVIDNIQNSKTLIDDLSGWVQDGSLDHLFSDIHVLRPSPPSSISTRQILSFKQLRGK